ncbi:MAG: hypothetical protein OHK0024_06640 [Thalassobaculales bacterium]
MIQAVIVTWNAAAVLPACLASIASRRGVAVEVVDCGSTDASLAQARAAGAAVRPLGRNLGYSGGHNAALREILARADPPDYVAILNPDLVLPPGLLDRLADLLDANPGAGLAGPARVQRPGPPKSLFGWPDARALGGGVFAVDRLWGACMLVRPAVFQAIGLFDEAYFLYWEEVDFCHRARRAGFQALMDCRLALDHRGAGPAPHRAYYMARNRFLFARRNIAPALRPLFHLKWTLANDSRLLLAPATRAAALAGLAAGLAGEQGRAAHPLAQPPAPPPGQPQA